MTVVAVHRPEKLADTLAAIYHASFAELKEVHTPESLMPILAKVFGERESREIVTKVSFGVVGIPGFGLSLTFCSQQVMMLRSF